MELSCWVFNRLKTERAVVVDGDRKAMISAAFAVFDDGRQTLEKIPVSEGNRFAAATRGAIPDFATGWTRELVALVSNAFTPGRVVTSWPSREGTT